MAVATAPQQRKAKRKPLDAARVYQSWLFECRENGERGAFVRVAERYNVSDESIRRLVRQHEAAIAPKPARTPELAYVPPDEAYEAIRAAANATLAASLCPETTQAIPHEATPPACPIMSNSDPIERENVALAAAMPYANATPHHATELENNQRAPRHMPHEVVRRVVIRVPVETPRAGLVEWLQSHPIATKQAVAVLAVLALILICLL